MLSFKSYIEEAVDWDDIHSPEHGVFPVPHTTAKQKSVAMHYGKTPSTDKKNGHCSSKNINAVFTGTNKVSGDHTHEKIKDAADTFRSIFSEKNTNKKSFTAYSGIHSRHGEKYAALKSGDKVGVGSLSASTEKSIGVGFARHHLADAKNGEIHVKVLHHAPGTAISMANLDPRHDQERETLTHPDAKAEYSHSEHVEADRRNKERGVSKIIYHHFHIKKD